MGTAPTQPGNYSFPLKVSDSQTPPGNDSITVTFSVIGIHQLTHSAFRYDINSVLSELRRRGRNASLHLLVIRSSGGPDTHRFGPFVRNSHRQRDSSVVRSA